MVLSTGFSFCSFHWVSLLFPFIRNISINYCWCCMILRLFFRRPFKISKVILGWMHPKYKNNVKLSQTVWWTIAVTAIGHSPTNYIFLPIFFYYLFLGLIFSVRRAEDWMPSNIVVVEVLFTRLCEQEWLSVWYVCIIHMIIQWTTCIFKLKINLNASKWWIILIYSRLHIYIWLHFYVHIYHVACLEYIQYTADHRPLLYFQFITRRAWESTNKGKFNVNDLECNCESYFLISNWIMEI